MRITPRAVLIVLILLGTAGALVWDFPWWKPIQSAGLYPVGRPEPRANDVAFQEAAALIPADASLATDNLLGPQLAHRRGFYFFPYWEAWRADYILVDLQSEPPAADERTRALRLLLSCPVPRLAAQLPEPLASTCRDRSEGFAWETYAVRYWRDGMLLLQRGWPVDPALHQQVQVELEQLQQENR